jgi:ubiquinone/menaquinone biosynthesis C-methylase UbiE
LYKSFGYDIDKERAFIIKQAEPIQGNILEAGTGKGHFALELAKAGYRFTTFDISETEQAFAKLNLKYFSLDHLVDFRIENGESLSFEDKSFDVIFSINTFHHLINPYKVLDELIRLLTFKGKLVLSDFTKEGLMMMDKIHALEGRKHEVSEIALGDIKAYLTKNDFDAKQESTRYQDVLIAQKGVVK